VRLAFTATTLVNEHDAVRGGVEEAALLAVSTTAWTSVDKDDRLALRVTRLFTVDFVKVGDTKEAGAVGLDLGIKSVALGAFGDHGTSSLA
jgi:hypothetical protein